MFDDIQYSDFDFSSEPPRNQKIQVLKSIYFSKTEGANVAKDLVENNRDTNF